MQQKQTRFIELYQDREHFFLDIATGGGVMGALALKILQCPELSFKAKAMYLLIQGNPEVFKNPKGDKRKFLLEHSKEKWDALTSGINELMEKGLLFKQTHRNEGPGRKYITGSSWIVGIGNLDFLSEEDLEKYFGLEVE